MDLTKLIKTQRGGGPETPLNILFASSEVAPFSKTGGLGDVAGALPSALAGLGHHVQVITPLYKHIDPAELSLSLRLRTLEVPRKARSQSKVEVRLWEGRMNSGARVVFVDAPQFFDRDGVYGYDADAFEDNAARFAFFSRAVVEFARASSVDFDVVHCNDWHTGLVPIYAKRYYADEFADSRFVFTIHNLAYQGVFDAKQFNATGLPKGDYLKEDALLHDGSLNYLKGGILFSDAVTTVSQTYAEEIQTEEGGCGLHEALASRGGDVSGILNGADYGIWSPESDDYIDVRYDVDTLNGKRQNKAALQHGFGLPVRPTMPLLGFVGRLTEQKGLDILIPALRGKLEALENERVGFQVVFLGEGEKRYVEALEKLQADFPRRVGVRVGYEEELAHKLQAGSDILLVPSRFEPCGLTQLYALRYGTLPLVHATGGLADTVIEGRGDDATGFVFEGYEQGKLEETLDRATATYRKYRQWRPLMVNAMRQEFSWGTSARSYEALYTD